MPPEELNDAPEQFESAFTQASATPEPVAPAAPVESQPTSLEQSPPVAAPPPQPSPAQPPANQLLEMARQAGLQIGDTSTSEEVARLAIQQMQSLNSMAQYGQQILPHAAEFQKFLEQQQQPAPAATPEDEWTPDKYFGEQWGAQWDPKYSQAIEQGLVTRDPQTGLWAPAPGYEMTVAGMLPQLNEAQQRQSQNWQEITRGNPYQHFYEKLQEPLRREWQRDMESAIQAQFERVKQEQSIDQFEKTNSAWLYAQQNGQRTVTPQGQKFLSAVDDLQKSGVSDPEVILRLAQQIAGVSTTAPPAAAPTVPVVPNVAAANQAQQQSFLQNAISRSGHAAGAVANAGGPVAVEENDLNSMFISAYRASHGQGA